MKRTLFLFCLVAGFLFRCGGSEVGNPDIIALHVAGIDTSVAKLNGRALSGGISITEARIVLSEIQFRSFSSCQDGATDSPEIRYEGPYVVNLLTNASIPDIGTATIPSDRYCRIELKIKRLDDNQLPVGISSSDALIKHSIRIVGTRQDGTPFEASLSSDADLRLVNETTGFLVGLNGITDLFITFDYSKWFTGINLDTADVTSGKIFIDEDHNSDLLNLLRSNLKTSSSLFEDSNKDGSLEPSEHNSGSELANGVDL